MGAVHSVGGHFCCDSCGHGSGGWVDLVTLQLFLDEFVVELVEGADLEWVQVSTVSSASPSGAWVDCADHVEALVEFVGEVAEAWHLEQACEVQ